jgi:hypothetical protein
MLQRRAVWRRVYTSAEERRRVQRPQRVFVRRVQDSLLRRDGRQQLRNVRCYRGVFDVQAALPADSCGCVQARPWRELRQHCHGCEPGAVCQRQV